MKYVFLHLPNSISGFTLLVYFCFQLDARALFLVFSILEFCSWKPASKIVANFFRHFYDLDLSVIFVSFIPEGSQVSRFVRKGIQFHVALNETNGSWNAHWSSGSDTLPRVCMEGAQSVQVNHTQGAQSDQAKCAEKFRPKQGVPNLERFFRGAQSEQFSWYLKSVTLVA